MVRKYAVFSGRSRRKEYWYFTLFYVLISVVLTATDYAVGTLSYFGGIGLLTGIFDLALLLPYIAVTIRRLHDIDRTGWWFFISLIPLIGAVVLLVFMLTEGTKGSNRYGLDPNPLRLELRLEGRSS